MRSGEELSSALFAGAVVNVVLEIGVRSWIFRFLLEERKEVTQTFGIFFSFLDELLLARENYPLPELVANVAVVHRW